MKEYSFGEKLEEYSAKSKSILPVWQSPKYKESKVKKSGEDKSKIVKEKTLEYLENQNLEKITEDFKKFNVFFSYTF